MKSVFDNCTIACTKIPADDDLTNYIRNDLAVTTAFYYGLYPPVCMNIKNVIFNEPATIVLWTDGTKTVVKCSEDDTYDPEKGLAMAISKKILGDKFKSTFNKYLPETESATMFADGKPIGKVTKITQDSTGVKAEVKITDKSVLNNINREHEQFENTMKSLKEINKRFKKYIVKD